MQDKEVARLAKGKKIDLRVIYIRLQVDGKSLV